MLLENSIIPSFVVIGFGILLNLNLVLASSTKFIKPIKTVHQPLECRHLWSTEVDYKNQYSVSCAGSDHITRVCDARTCHMGGSIGSPDSHPWNKELFFSKCYRLDSDKNIIIPSRTMTIFPRSYICDEAKKTLVAHGLEVSGTNYEEGYFQCAWEDEGNGNNGRIWCNSCEHE